LITRGADGHPSWTLPEADGKPIVGVLDARGRDH